MDQQDLSPKARVILDAALALLIEAGDAGLTMRKLAERADMRLSNVQYYFKTRDDVLAAMVLRYFEECTANLVALTQEATAASTRERVHFLIRAGLKHGEEITDICRAFREIWAISSRNDVIEQCLIDYYRRFADVIAVFAFGPNSDAASRDRFKTLILPYLEGYSVTAKALPQDADQTATMLTELAFSLQDAPPEQS